MPWIFPEQRSTLAYPSTDIRHFSKFFQGIFIPLQHRDDFFERLCGFRSSVVLSHPLGEEADDPELILGHGDHLTFVTSRNLSKAFLSPCNIGMIFLSVYVASGAP